MNADSIRMRERSHRLVLGVFGAIGVALAIAGGAAVASADPLAASPPLTKPDYPPGPTTPTIPPANFRPTWDLDGFYIWLGPEGAASHLAGQWDSTFGGDLTLMRVRERAWLGTIGGSFGAARWTARGGGRLWLDAIAGTRVLGYMVGVSAGPSVDLADDFHPRIGGSVGVWGFSGVTPYARIGEVSELGAFVEIGVHIALPVFRR